MADQGGYAVLHEDPEKEKRRKKEKMEDDLMTFDMIMGSVEKIFDRTFEMEDPVIRYTMFLDKLYTSLDLAPTSRSARRSPR